MQVIPDVLQNIGLADKEIEIYIAALKLGPQPASVIARTANLNRSTTYTILESLFRKGLISQFVKAEVKYFSVVSPENLVGYVDRMINDLKRNRDELLTSIPQFLALTNPISARPKVLFFEGMPSVKDLYEQISKYSDEVILLVHYESMFSISSKNAILTIKNEYIAKRMGAGRRVQVVMFVSPKYFKKAELHLKNEKNFDHRNFSLVVDKEFPKELEINFWGDKLAFIRYSDQTVMGVVINDKIIVEGMKVLLRLFQQS